MDAWEAATLATDHALADGERRRASPRALGRHVRLLPWLTDLALRLAWAPPWAVSLGLIVVAVMVALTAHWAVVRGRPPRR